MELALDAGDHAVRGLEIRADFTSFNDRPFRSTACFDPFAISMHSFNQ